MFVKTYPLIAGDCRRLFIRTSFSYHDAQGHVADGRSDDMGITDQYIKITYHVLDLDLFLIIISFIYRSPRNIIVQSLFTELYLL